MAVAYLFDEILFDPDIITMWGQGSPTYANRVARNEQTGARKVNVTRFDPKERWLIDLELMTPAKRRYMMKMWRGGAGSAVGFRVRVPTDFVAILEAFATGNGSTTQFPLYMTYYRPGVGDHPDVRRVTKPVVNTNLTSGSVTLYEADGVTTRAIPSGAALAEGTTGFKIFFNSTEQTSGWTVNNKTGVVTFTSPPANGTTIKWSGEFDTPMAFVPNSFNQKFDVASSIQGLELEEILPVELGIT